MKAEEKETITLGEQEGTVITPEPDVQAAPVENTAEDDSVTGAESAQAEADAADEAPETEETTQSEPVTETEASAAEDAAEPEEDSEAGLQDEEDTEIEEEKTGKGRLSAVFGVIGGLILAAAAAVSVLLWRKKNPKQ